MFSKMFFSLLCCLVLLFCRALAAGTSYPPATTYTYSDFTLTITPAPTPSAIITLPPAPTGIAEIDIIFPREGATYPLLGPFPVIFALQQPEILYKYGFEVDWSFSPAGGCDPDSDNYAYCYVNYGSISPAVDGTDFPVPDVIGNGPIFAYDNATEMAPGVWVMTWEFDISRHCDDLYLIVEIHQYAEIANGTVTFTIEDGAPMPTLTSSCPAVAGLVSYWGTVSATLADGSIFQGCPGTATSPPAASATPCAASLNAEQASSISSALSLSVFEATPTQSPTPTQASETSSSHSSTGLQTSITLTTGRSQSSASATSTLTVIGSSSPTPNFASQISPDILVKVYVLCIFFALLL